MQHICLPLKSMECFVILLKSLLALALGTTGKTLLTSISFAANGIL